MHTVIFHEQKITLTDINVTAGMNIVKFSVHTNSCCYMCNNFVIV